jgi:cell division inhibitor SepF
MNPTPVSLDEDELVETETFEEYSEDTLALTPRTLESSAKSNRITVINPSSYNDARLVGEPYRSGMPVIMNLSKVDTKTASRFVDFALGLTYGLQGHLEQVTSAVYLLSPQTIEVQSTDQLSDTGEFFSNESVE